MSYRVTTHIICNKCGGMAHGPVLDIRDVVEARREVRRKGWRQVVIDGHKQDWCSGCVPQLEFLEDITDV